MKDRKLILILILIIEIIAIITFNHKYTSQFNFSKFMYKLEHKTYDIEKINSNYIMYFRKVFNYYYDNAAVGFCLCIMLSLAIMTLTIIELICLLICQVRILNNGYKISCGIYLSLHCFANMLIYLYLAINAEYKVNLSDDEIYVFDDEFNQEIKKNLDYMFYRKIYLIVCSFVAVFGIIIQFIIMISNVRSDNTINNYSIDYKNDTPCNNNNIDYNNNVPNNNSINNPIEIQQNLYTL